VELPLNCAVLTIVLLGLYTLAYIDCACVKIKCGGPPFLHFLKYHRPTSILGRRPEHGSFTRASSPVLAQKGWYCFVRNKTIKIFLSQNKFIEACQWQTPRRFNWFTDIFQVKNA